MMEDKLENNRLKYVDYTFKRHGIDPDSIEGQLIYYAYGHGYHQAEKDNELTLEDISIIRQIMFDYNRQIRNEMSIPNDKEYCEEILKRFKEKKETKD